MNTMTTRQYDIIHFVKEQRRVDVDGLVRCFDVFTRTIRRNINELLEQYFSDQKLVGGVCLFDANNVVSELWYARFVESKQKMATTAALIRQSTQAHTFATNTRPSPDIVVMCTTNCIESAFAEKENSHHESQIYGE